MKGNKRHVPYPVIEAAISGDAEALQMVVDHYDGYIKKISTVKMVDGMGNEQNVADMHLCEVLKVHLITAILKFDMRK